MSKSDAPLSEGKWMLIEASALPEVYERVLTAKHLLASGEADSAVQAARAAGLSRSAFYKYKDLVFPYDTDDASHILTVHVVLLDRPGVLSALLTAFAEAGANVLTVNQNIPSGGTASVSVSARTDRLVTTIDRFLNDLADLPGVRRVSGASGDGVTTKPKKDKEREKV